MANSNYNPLSNVTNATTIFTDDYNATHDDKEYQMKAEVLESDPKQIYFEEMANIMILFTNESDESQELLNVIVQDNEFSQIRENNLEIPFVVDKHSTRNFTLSVFGKFMGRAYETVNFIFKCSTIKVLFNVNVIHRFISAPAHSQNYIPYRKIRDDKRLCDMLSSRRIVRGRGVNPKNPRNYSPATFQDWPIPSSLWNCFWDFHRQFNGNNNSIKMKISELYPEILETLTHQNYKQKFHTLLYIHEIEETKALQKYAQDRVVFSKQGEYLAMFIQNIQEQRPFLIPGHKVIVTDDYKHFCSEGKFLSFEGIIHSIHQHHIYLKFRRIFHRTYRPQSVLSIIFMPSRRPFRRLHDMVDELWGEEQGKAFLFPVESPEYRAPKLIITSLDDIDAAANPEDSLDSNLNDDGAVSPSCPPAVVIEKIKWFNRLNEEQKSAVINILKAEGRRLPYIIYGPPGTGKTITLTESIIQVQTYFPDSKILVCAPTNSSINVLLDMLVASEKFNATSMKRLLSYTYLNSSSYTDNHSDYCVLPEVETNLKPKNKKSMQITDILKSKIILSTMGTVDVLNLAEIKHGIFTHIFLDEAGQMTEPTTLHALSMFDPINDRGQVIMAGDPKQLGPVLCSSTADTCGLGQSMLARYINNPPYKRDLSVFPEHNGYNPKVITHLIQNYRSLPEIVSVFSDLFYESLVVATKMDDDEEERIFLNSLTSDQNWRGYPKGPLIVHGVVGQQSQLYHNPSWFNAVEVVQIIIYLKKLHSVGIDLCRIGIVTPYSSQVDYIKTKLMGFNPMPKVGTAETFQGQEEMVIIVSLVRNATSNSSQQCMGLAGQAERINVAISRARALVIVLGDPEMMYANQYLRKILLRAVNDNNYIGCKPKCI